MPAAWWVAYGLFWFAFLRLFAWLECRRPLRHRWENCPGTWAMNYRPGHGSLGPDAVECITCNALFPATKKNRDTAARENSAGYALKDLADEGVELFGEPWTPFAEPWRGDDA